jgi:hypothetical protein
VSEHAEQVGLFQVLSMFEDKYPALKWIHAIPNGGHRHVAVAKRMKAEGVKAGVWDIFVPVAADDKAGLYIEMKYGKNKLTDNQEAFRDAIGDAYEWAVCYSMFDACHAIGEYLDIVELREAE